MTIGERIKNRRIELGLTQTELAVRMGKKSRVSVCTVEKDKEDLTTTRIRAYAEALECSPAYLMGWEDREDETNKAMELYAQYESLPPDKQTAFLNYLKFLQSGS